MSTRTPSRAELLAAVTDALNGFTDRFALQSWMDGYMPDEIPALIVDVIEPLIHPEEN